MRYTADKLAQRLDFLCLQQRCLGPLATRNFFSELTVRPLKVSRPLGHQPLQVNRNSPAGLEVRGRVSDRLLRACWVDTFVDCRVIACSGRSRKPTLRRRTTSSRLNAAHLGPSLWLVSTMKG